ncbi:uncharacterized protein I303_106687 [Kwoniella dejecticola CBS 10117]|uniref:Uncharacterized protein n=1 Tax=Kwoniella dejecticola CBS 10117 TaxID=1296121 RepID=A0AAJ8KUH7_9TREE
MNTPHEKHTARITSEQTHLDHSQLAFEEYIAKRWKKEEGMKEWPKEYPVFWEGAGPAGLGRERDERDS